MINYVKYLLKTIPFKPVVSFIYKCVAFTFGFTWFIISTLFYCLMVPFNYMSFKDYTTYYLDDFLVIRGTSLHGYFWELVSGKRFRWLDEFIINRDIRAYGYIWEGTDIYKVLVEGQYVGTSAGHHSLVLHDVYYALINGKWSVINETHNFKLCQ